MKKRGMKAPQTVEKGRIAALTAALDSVVYVYVHSFALSLVALHCNPFERSWPAIEKGSNRKKIPASGQGFFVAWKEKASVLHCPAACSLPHLHRMKWA